MDIKMWRSSTVKPDRVRDRVGSMTHEPSGSGSGSGPGSSKLVWKVIWKKLRREGKKLLVRLPSKHVCAPYDEHSYAQNFDQGSEWRNDLDILSRSFSVQYTNRPSTVF